MSRVRISDQAREDLAAMWEYIAQDNPSAADRLLQRIVGQFKVLSEYPGAGRSCNELRPGLRRFVVGNYLILYSRISDGIAVVRVVHGARDLERLLEQETEETYRFDDEQ